MVHVWSVCQKAPSAKRCIKTQYDRQPSRTCCLRQKAPSAKRCIKTTVPSAGRQWPIRVRKHRAPKGALRPRANATDKDFATLCQKAPSAKRCIMTIGRILNSATCSAVSESTERQKVH